MKKLSQILSVFVILGAAGVFYWRAGELGQTPDQLMLNAKASAHTGSGLRIREGGDRDIASLPIAEEQAVSKPGVFTFQKELDDSLFLKQKIILTPSEKEEKKRILTNPEFLKALGGLLRVPAAKTYEGRTQQNIALDLLLESLRNPQVAEVANQILKEIIEDKTIEGTTANFETRQELASIKAEVLYKWSALQPSRKSEFARMLPGPVSQILWQNVLSAQATSLGEAPKQIR